MSDRYNCKIAYWIGKLVGNKSLGYAVTFGQTTFYSLPREQVVKDRLWMLHENRHKEQYIEQGGIFLYLVKYFAYCLRYGYTNNPFEVDARKCAQERFDAGRNN